MVVLFFPISLCSAKPPTATHQPELLFRVLISSSDDDSLVFPVHPIYCSSFPALATVRPQRWMCREKSIPNPATKELPKILPSSEHDIISLDKKRELCEEGRGNGQRGIELLSFRAMDTAAGHRKSELHGFSANQLPPAVLLSNTIHEGG
ncbi:uncharacterized [Tachysurus ichikawai]